MRTVHKLLKPKYRGEREKLRAYHMAQVAKEREFRRQCQALKDRLDLFGDQALTEEEKTFVASRPAFFHPGREE